MPPPIPPLLSPYLRLPPESSLILLTHVLGASTNWLVLRYLYSALTASDPSAPSSPHERVLELEPHIGARKEETNDDDPSVVLLISFMRDLPFWRDAARKLGLDLSRLAQRRRFAFVDGVSGLCLPRPCWEAQTRDATVLSDVRLESVHAEVLRAVGALRKGEGAGRRKVVLVVDQMDFLLAAGGEGVHAVALSALLMEWRQIVHSTIVTLAADSPLVLPQHTPLETNHAAFLLSIAHQARPVLGVRLLDTGTARDISGVVRITKGDADEDEDENETEYHVGDEWEAKDGKEFLYYVGADGGVKVFERGQ
ncbi:MAG: hypothetical protein M1818_008299 [Claussenomyces sp. TS43310]|nr:MAG: hypothetical protein M1818_008299 [Claussenomyces sp. TS43310]